MLYNRSIKNIKEKEPALYLYRDQPGERIYAYKNYSVLKKAVTFFSFRVWADDKEGEGNKGEVRYMG